MSTIILAIMTMCGPRSAGANYSQNNEPAVKCQTRMIECLDEESKKITTTFERAFITCFKKEGK